MPTKNSKTVKTNKKKTSIQAKTSSVKPKVKSKAIKPVRVSRSSKTKIQSSSQVPFADELKDKNLGKKYLFFALVTLLITTVVWSYLGAKLHQANSDQITNSYMFNSWADFHSSVFPASHSFLVKWPIFIVAKLFGVTPNSLMLLTVALCITTVGGLAYLLYKIESRPYVYGTIILALASVLLLVPPMPYSSGILPVNMAMIATRNIEYLVFIASLVILVKWTRFKSKRFILGLGLLGILCASDRLFLTITVVGSIISSIVYFVFSRWRLFKLTTNWLFLSIGAGLVSYLIIKSINYFGLTKIGTSYSPGPYGLADNLHDIALATFYSVFGMLTNFGANPAYSAAIVKDIPKVAMHNITTPAALTYLNNFIIFIVGIFATFIIVLASIFKPKSQKLDNPAKLSILLFWSFIASLIAFIGSKHYYFVDSRYLTIGLFTVFVSIASHYKHKVFKSNVPFVLIGFVLSIGILAGLNSVASSFYTNKDALADINYRNYLVSVAIKSHPVDTLVGNYWRVVPLKFNSKYSINVYPTQDCTNFQELLASNTKKYDLNEHSFAYLLSLDSNLTNYPRCTIKDPFDKYGAPNQTVLISGSIEKPKELLLFYDRGAFKSAPKTIVDEDQANIKPIPLNKLPYTTCKKNNTIMNIVAHEDDDLLFLSPDLFHSIENGNCIRTIYITAGDAGSNSLYWQGRETGSETAYNNMFKKDNIWIHRVVKLAENKYITVANPHGDSRHSLIYFRLPDGNIRGQGFRNTHYQGLARMEYNPQLVSTTADGQSMYNHEELKNSINELIHLYKPAEIRTQLPYSVGYHFMDHSDHMAVGRLVKSIVESYSEEDKIPTKYYMGYPIIDFRENVLGEDYNIKLNTFLNYAKYDNAVCHSAEECNITNKSYGGYLRRQYSAPF